MDVCVCVFFLLKASHCTAVFTKVWIAQNNGFVCLCLLPVESIALHCCVHEGVDSTK